MSTNSKALLARIREAESVINYHFGSHAFNLWNDDEVLEACASALEQIVDDIRDEQAGRKQVA